jgi:hypothetical protein
VVDNQRCRTIRAGDINLQGTPVRQPELERDEVHDLAV